MSTNTLANAPAPLKQLCLKPTDHGMTEICLARDANAIASDALSFAQGQTYLAGASLLLGIAGTVGLLWNLILARRQTSAALNAADEARRANEMAAEHAITGSRPWMAMEMGKSKRIYDLTRRDLGPPDGQTFWIEWGNSGVTPALLRARGERLLVWRRGDPEPTFGAVEMYQGVASIASGKTFYSAEREIRGRDYDDWRAGRAIVFLRCAVTYTHPMRPTDEYRSELTVRFMLPNQMREGEALVPNPHITQYGQDNIFT